MSSYNTYSNFYLAREIRTKLGLFRYQNDFGTGNVNSFKDLKEQILSGQVSIRIMDDSRFKVVISGKRFNEAICRRHYFGVRRIHRLCRSAEHLASEKWATAWTLTTCYYAAFFAAIELLHVTGKQVSYFSAEEIIVLNTQAHSSNISAQAGTYLGVAIYDSSSGNIEINYAQTGKKPHEFAWFELKGLIQQTTAGTSEAIRHRETLLRLLGASTNTWPKPNDIRNRWNYADATLFCERGESLGQCMNERILKPEIVHQWGVNKHVQSSEKNEATGLAYLRASLVEAVDSVATAVLPGKLASSLTS